MAAGALAGHDVSYRPAEHSRSELYLELLPLVNSARIELLDLPRLVNQLCALERRTARGGRDSVDHPLGAHDDLINAAAGALVIAARPSGWDVLEPDDEVAPDFLPSRKAYQEQIGQLLTNFQHEPDPFTCGACVARKLRNQKPWCTLRCFFVDDHDPGCELFAAPAGT